MESNLMIVLQSAPNAKTLTFTGDTMDIHYLEIVTTQVDDVCDTYTSLTNADFSGPVEALGNARTAQLTNGGRIGVRAPMHSEETPAVRSYMLVDDAQAALDAAVAKGGEIVHPAFELPGEGIFGIYSQGGIMHGVWQR
ncbi:MAG: hydroxylase [Gammaproteobacteria bacterium]